jgi:AcrR family transcriptional regulator
VIAEVGVDGATTNAIAARAHTSVGSLYQFFPNKDAIVHALAARYTAEFEQLKDRVMALEVADLPLDRMMRGIVEPIAAYCDANPAYRHVYAATSDAVAGPSPTRRGCTPRWWRASRRSSAPLSVGAAGPAPRHGGGAGRDRARDPVPHAVAAARGAAGAARGAGAHDRLRARALRPHAPAP